MNFHQLDLNSLRVLVAIHRTGTVTLGGKALALSQTATSSALARLRDFFEDELVVRAPTGLKPTRVCEQLAPAVMAQLSSMESLLTGHVEFDPAASKMHWHTPSAIHSLLTYYKLERTSVRCKSCWVTPMSAPR